MLKHNAKLKVIGRPLPTSKITWLTGDNYRIKGKRSYDRYEKYFGASTVAEYKARGGTAGDLLWDIRSGALAVEGISLGGTIEPRKLRVPKATKAEQATAAAL